MLGPEVSRIGQESIFGSFVHLSYLEHNSKEYIDNNVEEHVKSISAGDMVMLEIRLLCLGKVFRNIGDFE